MRSTIATLVLGSWLAFSAGCGGERTTPSVSAEAAPITLAVSGRTNAAASVAALGQTVAAVWTASVDSTSDIYISVSRDGGKTFDAPARVNDVAGDARASGEQAARVAVVPGHTIHVAWPARHDGRSVIRYAASKDAGRTFSSAITIAGDGATGARGWHSLAIGYDGAVHTAWLDGRNAAPSPMTRIARDADRTDRQGTRLTGHVHGAAAAKPKRSDGGPRQDIFHASWKGAGDRVEHPVQSNVCFCCKTAVATSGELVYVAWRHIYPESLRDIAVARSTDNGATFGAPIRVSEDGWKIDACPDDGPAMVADGHGGIHIAWPTLAPGETPRKGIFYSRLANDTFAPRLRLDTGDADPAHPQIASDEHTNVAVVWDEMHQGTRRVVFRRVSEGVPQPAQLFAGDGVSYPTVAGGDGYWVVLWTAQALDGRSVLAGRRIPAASTH
jgi:hypothetical protein